MQHPGLTTIDCFDRGELLSAAYLVRDGDEVAFIDNNTVAAVPRLLGALRDSGAVPEQVRYLVVTHAHFDHAGGTEALLRHCPHATVLAHPLAARHLIQPTLLTMSARSVFGSAVFAERFGSMAPLDATRVTEVHDGQAFALGKRELRFVFTPGHANHHASVLDTHEGHLFCGDSFGALIPAQGPRRLIPLVPPPDFDLAASLQSIDRMLALQPQRLCLTHYGAVEDFATLGAQLKDDLVACWDIAQTSLAQAPSKAEAGELCARVFWDRHQALTDGAALDDALRELLRGEWLLNARGMVETASRTARARVSA